MSQMGRIGREFVLNHRYASGPVSAANRRTEPCSKGLPGLVDYAAAVFGGLLTVY